MDSMLSKYISNSYIVNKFKKSENYKTAKTLFELLKIKKNLDEFREGYIEFLEFDVSKYFPLNNKVSDPKIVWRLYKKYYDYIIAIPTKLISHTIYNCYYQFFDNLKSKDFLILWCDLEPLLISETLKLQLPYVSNNYLIKLLKSYLDLQYKFINMIDFKIGYLEHCLHMLQTDYGFKIIKNLEKFRTNFFWYPKLGDLKTSFSLLTNDTYLIAIFYGKSYPYSSDISFCAFIYSNINPIENKELEKLKNDLSYLINYEFILEIENNFQNQT
jgi:hypothetical protein